jgi:hypothetical protein
MHIGLHNSTQQAGRNGVSNFSSSNSSSSSTYNLALPAGRPPHRASMPTLWVMLQHTLQQHLRHMQTAVLQHGPAMQH